MAIAAVTGLACSKAQLAPCADCSDATVAPPADAPVTSGCGSAADCGSGQDCCGGACIDVTADPNNCGQCGMTCGGLGTTGSNGAGAACCASTCKALGTLSNCSACGDACGSGDFCANAGSGSGGLSCEAPTYPNFCKNTTVYEILDGITADVNACALMGSTITANCPMDVTVQTANQTDATLIDQTTGQPLGGPGVTYVLAGGPFAELAVKWLEQTQQVTKIYFAEPDSATYAWMIRGNPTPVETMTPAQCTGHFDQFVVELVTDPMSGTLSLIGYGVCKGGAGTFGAAYYYANVMLPNAAMYPDSWYIVSWTDTDGDGVAGSGDSYAVLAHGI